MLLIESVVLHDRIFYLPASLPDDAYGLKLRNLLVESGVLMPLPKGGDYNLIGQALLASLGTVSELRRVAGTGSKAGRTLSFDDFRPLLMKEIGQTETIANHHPKTYVYSRVAAEAESFDQAAQSLISRMEYARSGAYEGGAASLRAMYYVFASEHYGLPFLASASVQEVQSKFPNYFKPSLRGKLYEQLASALQVTVDKIAQQFSSPTVFVPPFSAIVLSRAAGPADIPAETLALREEYSDFRRKMCELEREQLEARSLNDRLSVLRRIEELGKEVTRPFDQPSQMKLETAIRYIPDAADLATNPTNPGGWAKVLLGLPTEALLSWYRRRPVAKLLRTARAVSKLQDYDRLLAKHFSPKLASDALEIQSSIQDI
jgi:hypothetical protein